MIKFTITIMCLFILVEVNAQNFQQSPYVSGTPINLIERVGRQKQEVYDANLGKIQDAIDQTERIRTRLFRDYPDENKYFLKKTAAVVKFLNTNKIDYSNSSTVRTLLNEFKIIENEMYSVYDEL